jgi:hypothetical protein
MGQQWVGFLLPWETSHNSILKGSILGAIFSYLPSSMKVKLPCLALGNPAKLMVWIWLIKPIIALYTLIKENYCAI